ncbi:MAG: hypothetical protein U5J63_00515 [Fodinibius sp.]|nr:hypothetical protein [Fodinibius sp.]
MLTLLIILIWGAGCQSEQSAPTSRNISQISKIQQAISADTIKAHIQKLAGFYTRHTTSDTSSDTAGIGATRRWIYQKLNQYRKRSNYRLKVHYDRFVEDENSRLDNPTEIVNVIAVLPGKQLESKERTYIVSAHYDSRVSDVMDDTSYARAPMTMLRARLR